MNESVLIAVAHPDDETLGCAHELLRRHAQCRVLHITDGAPHEERFWAQSGAASREEYAWSRREELLAAMSTFGLAEDQLECLGFADRDAARHLDALADEITARLRALRPAVVYTHPFEGGHPDHDATAFAVQRACARLHASGEALPERREFTSYHARGEEFFEGAFLGDDGRVQEVDLSQEEQTRKRAALDCYASQQRVIQRFALSPQRWRLAPSYDFTTRPHEGPLYYEIRQMGYRFEDFKALVEAARND